MIRLRYLTGFISWLFFLIMSSYVFQGCDSNDNVAPTIPATLSAAVSPGQVGVSWSPSTDNSGVSGYRVFRDGVYIQSVGAPAALDSDVTGSIHHCYTVSAYDAAGNESAQSSAICTSSPSAIISSQCSIIPATATGFMGFVMRGPITPVCSDTTTCDEPFSAGFQIKENNVTIGAFQSTSEGCFAVQVPAGDYIIVPDADAPILSPQSQTRELAVGADLWTEVTFTFDTGIR